MKTHTSPALPPFRFTPFVVPELHGLRTTGAAASKAPTPAVSRANSFMSYSSATSTSRGSTITKCRQPHVEALKRPELRSTVSAEGAAVQVPLSRANVGASGSRFVEHLSDPSDASMQAKPRAKASRWAWPALFSALAILCVGLMFAVKRFVGFRA